MVGLASPDTSIPGVPRWRGEAIDGPLLLNTFGNGNGDAIQGIRFAPEARRRAREVVLLCDKGLSRLLGSLPGIDRVVVTTRDRYAEPDGLPPLAAQCQLWDLPGLFRVSPETMRGDRPYLAADPETIERWRPAIEGMPGFRIGVLWCGNPAYRPERNYRPADLEPLACVSGLSFVSLRPRSGGRASRRGQVSDAGPRP